MDAGSVTNTATASGTKPAGSGVTSTSSAVTVRATGASSSLTLSESAAPGTFARAGATVDFDYVVTNTGTRSISGVAVSDATAASVHCPDNSLAPGASETCVGSYTTTAADVSAAEVVSTATATGTNSTGTTVTSNSSSAEVTYTGFHITTTSLPSATVSQSYSVALAATGGPSPYKWKAAAALPKGLKLSSTGTLSGTAPLYAGSYTISVRVTSKKSKAAPSVVYTRSWTLTVSTPPGPSGVTCATLTGTCDRIHRDRGLLAVRWQAVQGRDRAGLGVGVCRQRRAAHLGRWCEDDCRSLRRQSSGHGHVRLRFVGDQFRRNGDGRNGSPGDRDPQGRRHGECRRVRLQLTRAVAGPRPEDEPLTGGSTTGREAVRRVPSSDPRGDPRRRSGADEEGSGSAAGMATRPGARRPTSSSAPGGTGA